MAQIRKNHWFINNNDLSISLLRFNVEINFIDNDNTVKIKIKDNNEDYLSLTVNSLEEAIAFTENVISNSKNKENIIDEYKRIFENNDIKKINDNKVLLSPEEVNDAIIEHFGANKSYKMTIREKLLMKDNQLNIVYYLTEHLNNDGKAFHHEIRLKEEDVKDALNNYIQNYNYELEDYKYVGGIHRVGYYFDEDTPHYDGVELNVKRINKKVLVRK